jgi:hypothetical protein
MRETESVLTLEKGQAADRVARTVTKRKTSGESVNAADHDSFFVFLFSFDYFCPPTSCFSIRCETLTNYNGRRLTLLRLLDNQRNFI